jgi:hypothetical protein
MEFDVTGATPPENTYTSIAIYSGGAYYAYGNRLALASSGTPSYLSRNNNAPIISDIIYLNAGEYVEIHVFQNGQALGMNIVGESSKCYVSIHKSS